MTPKAISREDLSSSGPSSCDLECENTVDAFGC